MNDGRHSQSSHRTLIDGLVFPECPRWHDGRLWFSDMHGRQVVAVTEDGEVAEHIAVDRPAGLGHLPDGSVLIASMGPRLVWRYRDGELTTHCDLAAAPGDFLNDMIVDSEGRAYVGLRIRRERGSDESPSCLMVIGPEGHADIAADGLIGPNGMALSADESTLFVAETHASRITAFDRDHAGRLSRRRVLADLAPLSDGRHRIYPDGIALDAEGALWIGTAMGRSCLRVLPGGELTQRWVPPGDRWAVACTLGGSDGKTLYLATCNTSVNGLSALSHDAAPPDTDHLAWARQHSQGLIESIRVDVPAVGTSWP